MPEHSDRITPSDRSPPPRFDDGEMLALYQTGRYEALCDQFLSVLRYFHENTLTQLSAGQAMFIERFIEVFLTLFTSPGLAVAERQVGPFIAVTRTISNLTALTRFGTTDAFLPGLLQQEQNFVRLLPLLSARNRHPIDRRAIFDANAPLAIEWYMQYAGHFTSVLNETVAGNLREHLSFRHPELGVGNELPEVFYGSTYVDEHIDRGIKAWMNASMRRRYRDPPRVAPDSRKIAVISGSWCPGHSSRRIYDGCFEALRANYDLTLFHVGTGGEPDAAMFDRVVKIPRMHEPHALGPLEGGGFGMLIFAEVGMGLETVILANRRLAPIQVCLLGHSVSTWGADVDYFISGAACEVTDEPERHYSERLVLLPGMGVVHEVPRVARPERGSSNDFVINCPWSCQKVSHRLLRLMKQILSAASRPVRFRLFLGGTSGRANDHLPFLRDIQGQLGEERVELVVDMQPGSYMARMNEGEFTLDSVHFGGCNIVSDSLYLRIPTICREGDRWYNRIGPEMLRRVGLAECVACSDEQYVALALRMIQDDAWRGALRQRLEAADLEATIYDRAEAGHFARAINYLTENHARLSAGTDRTAIRI